MEYNKMGGVPVLGHNVPIWAVVLIEFVLAYTLEILVGSPQSFKIACHYFNPQKIMPHSESDAIADLVKRMEEIKVELKQEIEEKTTASK